MKFKQIILITVLAATVFSIVGCGTATHTANAERRWERMMEEARLEAARESIEQGRLNYAIHLLEDLVESESIYSEQAKEMLAELRKVAQEFTQMREQTASAVGNPILY